MKTNILADFEIYISVPLMRFQRRVKDSIHIIILMKSIIQIFLHCFHGLTLVYPWSFMSKKNRRITCNISDKNEHFLFMFILVNIFCLLPQIYPSGRAYTIKFFFHDLEIFISKEKCRNISGSEMCVVKYSVCSHNQVSFIRS